MVVIQCNDISYRLTDNNPILEHTNLSVEEGEFLSIKGGYRSGKSTLFSILGLIIQPTSGTVNVYLANDKYQFDDIVDFRNRAIGLVFEQDMLNQNLTVSENIELPLRYSNYNSKERKLMVDEALEVMGLYHKRDHLPSQLSSFQKKITELARASILNARILLIDEPAKSMQANEKEIFYRKLYELNETNKTIILFQDKRDIDVATRTLFLSYGRLTHNKMLELNSL